MPHVLELYVSEHCIGCRHVTSVLQAFAATRDDVTLLERDVARADDRRRARDYGLLATPALVIDGGQVMYGVPRVEVLTRQLDRERAEPVRNGPGDPADQNRL